MEDRGRGVKSFQTLRPILFFRKPNYVGENSSFKKVLAQSWPQFYVPYMLLYHILIFKVSNALRLRKYPHLSKLKKSIDVLVPYPGHLCMREKRCQKCWWASWDETRGVLINIQPPSFLLTAVVPVLQREGWRRSRTISPPPILTTPRAEYKRGW